MYAHTPLHPRELAHTEESRLLGIKCQNKPEIFKRRRRRRNFSAEIHLKKMRRRKVNEALKMETGWKLCGRLAVTQAIGGGLLVYPRNTSVIKLLWLKRLLWEQIFYWAKRFIRWAQTRGESVMISFKTVKTSYTNQILPLSLFDLFLIIAPITCSTTILLHCASERWSLVNLFQLIYATSTSKQQEPQRAWLEQLFPKNLPLAGKEGM